MDREPSISANLKKGLGIIQSQGIGALIKKLGDRFSHLSYKDWIEKFDTLSNHDIELIKGRVQNFTKRPSFGIVLLPNAEQKVDFRSSKIAKTVKSLQSQIYSNWNLLIAGDSLLAETDELLQDISKLDSRIKIFELSDKSLNFDYIAKMYEGDQLSPNTLYLVAEHLQQNSPDIVYSDEDSIDLNGARSAPVFKSDWNPDLFKYRNYLGELTFFRIQSVGAFEARSPLEMLARIVEAIVNSGNSQSDNIAHLPFVLYHKSTQKREILQPRVAPKITHEPLVSVIILTKDKEILLRKCIDSILQKTTYKNYEIVIVDNGSTATGALKYLGELEAFPGVRVIKNNEPFNFSRLNNIGAEVAKGELLAFLNNDVEVIAPDWLSWMVAEIAAKEVGVVGARLWYPNNTLQHGGIVLGLGGIAGHALRGITKRDEPRDGFTDELSTVSAVTAACMLTRKSVFAAQSGFNERDLAVAYNDVDYCLRVQRHGFRVVYVPEAELYHHESATRRADYSGENIQRYKKECEYMRKEWGEALSRDPFFSPNLSLSGREINLAVPPRVKRPWRDNEAQ